MKIKRASIITKIVVLALILYAGITLAYLKVGISEAQEAKHVLEKEIAKIARSNAELQYEIDHSDSDETKEDIARNKLGLVKPGEKIFYDISD